MEQMLKFRHYEKAAKFKKNLLTVLTKQLFLLSNVKTSGRFLKKIVAFSEKLGFTSLLILFLIKDFKKIFRPKILQKDDNKMG